MDGRDIIVFTIGCFIGIIVSVFYITKNDEIHLEEKIMKQEEVINFFNDSDINSVLPNFFFDYLKLYSKLNLFPQIFIMLTTLSFIGIITFILEKLLTKTKLHFVLILLIVWFCRISFTSIIFFLINQTNI